MLSAKDYAHARRLDEKIKMLEDYVFKLEQYEYICFAKRKLIEASFWDMGIKKKNRGFPQILDVPEDLGIREIVVAKIYEKLKELKNELENYIKA